MANNLEKENLAESKSAVFDLAAMLIGLLLAVLILEYIRATTLVKLEDAALGTETQMVYESKNGVRVLCQDALDVEYCIEGFNNSGASRSVLWVGNSQLPAINRYQKGDATAPTIVFDSISSRGAHLVAMAQPNGNLLEHGIVFAALEETIDVSLLILPVFLDDMREQTIRSEISAFLDDKSTANHVRESLIWSEVSGFVENEDIERSTESSEVSLQDIFEPKFNQFLGRGWSLWLERDNLRGTISLAVHTLRNLLLGIDAQSKRLVQQDVYESRLGTLDAILRQAVANDVQVIVYIPPYRQDIEGPYDAQQYLQFKQDVESLVSKHGNKYLNLEGLVPGPEWGMVVDVIFGTSDYDFMHFTGSGHRRLAEALDRELIEMGH